MLQSSISRGEKKAVEQAKRCVIDSFALKSFILSFFCFRLLSSPSSAPAAHARYLGGGESLAEAGTTLSGVQVIAAGNLVGLLDNLLGLGEDELDVARVRHVGVDL